MDRSNGRNSSQGNDRQRGSYGNNRGGYQGNGHRDQGQNRQFYRQNENGGMWRSREDRDVESQNFEEDRRDQARYPEPAFHGGYSTRGGHSTRGNSQQGAYHGDFSRLDGRENGQQEDRRRSNGGYQSSRRQADRITDQDEYGYCDQDDYRQSYRRHENGGMWNSQEDRNVGSRNFRDDRRRAHHGGFSRLDGRENGQQEDRHRSNGSYQSSRDQTNRYMDQEGNRTNESQSSRVSVWNRISHRNSEDQDHQEGYGQNSRHEEDRNTEQGRNDNASSRFRTFQRPNEISQEGFGSQNTRENRQDEGRSLGEAPREECRGRGTNIRGNVSYRGDHQEGRTTGLFRRTDERPHDQEDVNIDRERNQNGSSGSQSSRSNLWHRHQDQESESRDNGNHGSRSGRVAGRIQNFQSSSRHEDYGSREDRNPAVGGNQTVQSSHQRRGNAQNFHRTSSSPRRWNNEIIKFNVVLIKAKLAQLDKDEEKQDRREERIEKQGGFSLLAEEDLWREHYRQKKEFSESVKRLSEIQNLDEGAAEEQLLDILVKATLVENSLMLHGQSTVEQLFRRMRFPNQKKAWHEEQDKKESSEGSSASHRLDEHVPDSLSERKLVSNEEKEIPEREREEYEQKVPFSSAEELFEFLQELVPLFKFDPSTGKWQNTGLQTRRFFQWLKKEMDGGHVFDLANFQNFDYPKFKATIEVQEEFRAFAEQELWMDYTSLEEFGLRIPGFSFNFETKVLSLSDQAPVRLSLNIPIMTALVNTATPLVMDLSRKWTGFITPVLCSNTGISHYVGVTGAMKGLKIDAFIKKFNQDSYQVSTSPLISASGFLWPGSPRKSGEVFQMEGATIDYFRDKRGLSTFKTSQSNDFDGKNWMGRNKNDRITRKEASVKDMEKRKK
uniref:PINc domain-containing protein n=1 Tax=Caenorhabditis tropicalis TaxID=1561998 RepID=A0A1I7TR41_9PELO